MTRASSVVASAMRRTRFISRFMLTPCVVSLRETAILPRLRVGAPFMPAPAARDFAQTVSQQRPRAGALCSFRRVAATVRGGARAGVSSIRHVTGAGVGGFFFSR